MENTRLSTKGQIVLPKAVRTSRAWGPGTEFTILRDARLFDNLHKPGLDNPLIRRHQPEPVNACRCGDGTIGRVPQSTQ